MTPDIDAHVGLDTRPIHPSAVQTVLTGTQARVASMALEAADWIAVTPSGVVLACIDHEERHRATDAAKHPNAECITIETTPRLQDARLRAQPASRKRQTNLVTSLPVAPADVTSSVAGR
ncbi:hypothetical protein [Streptomyces parvulus]|uniref:Uncharacterized protein n=1 Tax=Streptomyces parvulus TaxID=146923 RepID=A0ABV5DBX0_9ACTN